MVIGVLLTLVPAQSARLSARLHDYPRQRRLELRLPAYDSLCRRTHIAAVLAQADTADQGGHVVLAEIGVGAGRTALGTVRARLDAGSKCTGFHDGARRVRLQHLLRVSHRHSLPSLSRARQCRALPERRKDGGEVGIPRFRTRHSLSYSLWRRNQGIWSPVSSRPRGARSSHWYMPQRPSSPRA
jgi:hypothetical protein